ncbi:MAG: hypothetical protein WBP12_03335 [Candidatus Saccharimonas sp.]
MRFFVNLEPEIEDTGVGRVTLGYIPPAVGIRRVHERHEAALEQLTIDDLVHIMSRNDVLCLQVAAHPLYFTVYHPQDTNQGEIAKAMFALLQEQFGDIATACLSGVYFNEWRRDEPATAWLRQAMMFAKPAPTKFTDDFHSSTPAPGIHAYWRTNGPAVSDHLSRAVRTPVVKPVFRISNLWQRKGSDSPQQLLSEGVSAHPA